MRSIYFVLLLTMLTGVVLRVEAQPCTFTEADLLAGSGTFTIPAGQVLCITANFCMGAASNFPGACANSSVNSLIINGTLRIEENVRLNFAGSINGSGTIDILEGGRISLFGSINCAGGLNIRAIDASITSGTSSTSALVSCSDPGCEPAFSNGYKPFGIVSTGLGYTASGCTVVTGSPSPNTLPVALSDFTARLQQNEVLLTWKTNSEQNNVGFEVRWSDNGSQWTVAGKVPTKAPGGNSNEELNYQYQHPFTNGFTTRYYQLRQVDLNGADALSKIVLVNGKNANSMRATAARSAITLQLYLASGEAVSVKVTSAAGNVVYSASEKLQSGSNTVTVPARWARGIYVVIVQTGREIMRSRVLLP